MKNFLGLFFAIATVIAVNPLHAAERNYSIFGFDDIRINNGINVVIVTGKGPSARAEADNREILDRVSFRRGGNQLTIAVKAKSSDASNFSGDGAVTVYLSTYAIKKITHLGSGSVTLDELSDRSPQVRLGGFGNLTIDNVDSDKIMIAMNGGGQMKISGEARDARIELLGSSIFDGAGFTAEKLLLRHRGPAKSHIAVENEVEISNSGTGMIQIDGRPNCDVRTDGAAEIVCNPKR